MLAAGLLLVLGAAVSAATAEHLTPWLDVPAGWQRSVEEGVVAVVPDDVPLFASFLMLIEPESESSEPIAESYDRALVDLGPWKPVGEVQEVSFDNGWVFRHGVGVVDLNGEIYTAETAVARYGSRLVRFWVLADSDDTFNRYKNRIGDAIASVQDSTVSASLAGIASDPGLPGGAPAQPPGGSVAPPRSALDPAFGVGDSGVYVGLERGLSAGAGFGEGPRQTFNQTTGQFETSTTGLAPGVAVSISDYQTLDILFPDGSYRRSLPVRGLAGDLAWDRANYPIWWGRWFRDGDVVVTDRGGYRSVYRKQGDTLISDRDRPWVKLAGPTPGQSIEGSFARADYRDASAPRIVFYANGRYEDRGDFLRMVGSVSNLIVPDGDALSSRWSDADANRAMAGGTGTYRIDDFTLIFNSDDGRLWQFGFYLPPSASAAPGEMTIRTYRLLRD